MRRYAQIEKPIIALLAVIGFCLGVSVGYGQSTQTHDLSSFTEFSLADTLAKLKNYHQSDSVLLSIKDMSRVEEDWKKWHKAIYRLKKNGYKQNTHLALIDSLVEDIKILPEDQLQLQGKLRFHLGSVYSQIGRATKSIEYFQNALDYLRPAKDTLYIASTLSNLNYNYQILGDYYSALKFASAGKKLLENNPSHKKYINFIILESTAHLYNNDVEQAIEILEQALESQSKKNLIHLYLAECYIVAHDQQKAKEHLQQVPRDFHPYKLYSLWSDLYLAENKIELALEAQLKVVDFAKENSEPRKLVKQLARYAILLDRNNLLDQAAEVAHEAMSAYYSELDSTDIMARPPKQNNSPEIWMIDAAFIKAKYFQKKAAEGNRSAEQEIGYYFDFMFHMYDDLRDNFYTLESKYKLGVYSQKMYASAINYYLDQYKLHKNENSYERALYIAQLSNAYVLRNTISERKALEYAKVPMDDVNNYLDLKNNLLQAQNNNEPLIDSLIKPFLSLKSKIELNYPKSTILNRDNLLSVSDIQSKLTNEEILIKYNYYNNKLKVFSLTKIHLQITEIELDQSFLDQLSNLTDLSSQIKNIERPDSEQNFINSSRAVYQKLIEPIVSQAGFRNKTKLIIIPDGPIKNISFSTLLSKETDTWSDPAKYLLSEYGIKYLYFISQLDQINTQNEYQKDFVGFGIEYTDTLLIDLANKHLQNYQDSLVQNKTRSQKLAVLKNAVKEVVSCADIWGGQYWIDNEVTKKNILDNIKHARIAHFAVHALVDREDHKKSFIALEEGNTSDESFGYQDILSLDFSPELVVLSACQTSMGQDITGEGLMSLARIFSSSGSKATLGSYWNVPDRSTMILMDLFYNNLKQGMSKSESLQRAQIEYLTNDDLTSPSMRAPIHWAGWALYGDDKIIGRQASINANTSIYITAIVITLFLSFFFFNGKSNFDKRPVDRQI